MNDTSEQVRIDEIVVCHEIHEIPVENTSVLMWAASQTFTIRYLEDDAGGGGTENNHNSSNMNSNETNVNCNYANNQNGLESGTYLSNSNVNYDNNTCNNPISNGVIPVICESFSPTYSINPERVTTVPLETPFTNKPKVNQQRTTAAASNSTSNTFTTNGKRSKRETSTKGKQVVQIPNDWYDKSIKTEPPEAGTSTTATQINMNVGIKSKNTTILTPSSTSSSSENNEENDRNVKKPKGNSNRLLTSPIRCGVCDRKFTCMNKFHIHHLKHFGYCTKNFVQRQCCFCNHYFKSMQNLSLHLIIHYNKDRERCKRCKQLYVKFNVDTHECNITHDTDTNT